MGRWGGKRAPAKKVATKKAPPKKVAFKKAPPKKVARKKSSKPPAGYKRQSKSGILVPSSMDDGAAIVPTNKLEKGLQEAKESIRSMAYQVADSLGDAFDLAELELEVSFSADGKFMGFGVGGATSIRIKFTPAED
jgi:hypothetical protein